MPEQVWRVSYCATLIARRRSSDSGVVDAVCVVNTEREGSSTGQDARCLQVALNPKVEWSTYKIMGFWDIVPNDVI
jgi:hypothetical protein